MKALSVDIFMFILCMLISLIFSGFTLNGIALVTPLNYEGFLEFFLIPVMVIPMSRFYKTDGWKNKFPRRFNDLYILYGGLVLLIAVLFTHVLVYLLMPEILFPMGPYYSEMQLSEEKWGLSKGLTYFIERQNLVAHFSYIVVIPIAEKIIFRGMFLRRLLEKHKMIVSVFVSSIVFMLVHGTIDLIFLASGIMFSLLYIKQRKLILPIVFHIGSNLSMTLIALLGFNRWVFHFVFTNENNNLKFSTLYFVIALTLIIFFIIHLMKGILSTKAEVDLVTEEMIEIE